MIFKFKPGDMVVVKEHEPGSLEKCGLSGLEEEITSCVWTLKGKAYEGGYQYNYMNYKKYKVSIIFNMKTMSGGC